MTFLLSIIQCCMAVVCQGIIGRSVNERSDSEHFEN